MTAAVDEYDVRFAARARGVLAEFNRAGVLSVADVQVATRLGAVGGEADESVLLAVALTVRSTRHGSVVLDLATAEATTSAEDEETGEAALTPTAPLPWPEPSGWAARVAASPLSGGPLRVEGSRLWLARYREQEEQVARELLGRGAARPGDLDPAVLADGLERLFPRPEDFDQLLAAAACALTRVSVLAGGPGTGKTTTVSRVLALLREQHPDWRIALAAPTGKAAARLGEAVRSSTALLPEADRERLGDLPAVTLHRLLGWRPGARSRFRHDAGNRLPFEVVVVDEASMVSLTLMARLLEALRPGTRLVLVGDPDQLASVEAGAVLGDLVDPVTLGRRTPDLAAELARVVPGASVVTQEESPGARVRDGVSSLVTNRRFGGSGAIADLAGAIRAGNAPRALEVLRSGSAEIEFVELDDDALLAETQLAGVRADVVGTGAALHEAAEAGDARGALAALDRHRLLCAHRLGPRGVQRWSDLAAAWVGEHHPPDIRPDGRYLGEPLLVTVNDREIDLYNGDTGVVVRGTTGDLVAVFGRGGAPIPVPLARLGAVRPVHAMTIHRSQGSQFERVTVLLPAVDSPLGTRQTLYTAVTRAERHVRVIGSASAFTASVERAAARATGLRDRLSPSGSTG